jgi:hypothetical protein
VEVVPVVAVALAVEVAPVVEVVAAAAQWVVCRFYRFTTD